MLSKLAARRKDDRNAFAEMQHRHFATIAAMPADQRPFAASHFATYLPRTNPKFDRARFIYAATGEG